MLKSLDIGAENVKYMLIFIFILAANFIGDIYSCGLRLMLLDNMILKHLLGFFTLMIFVSSEMYENKSILDILKFTFILYVGFIMLMRTPPVATVIIITIMMICYGLTLQIEHLKDKDSLNVKKYTLYRKYLFILVLLTIILGDIIQYKKMRNAFKKDFSLYRFIVGIPNSECYCKS